MRYFVSGNLWLFVGLLLWIGRADGGNTPRYTFLGFGRRLDSSEYALVTFVPLAIAGIYFAIYRREKLPL
jgi:hypothetical protein